MVKAKITFLSLWSAVFLMSTWANSEEISWNGIYSGIHGGFAKSDVGWDEKIKYFLSDSETTYGARGSGFAGGVHIGINRQWNNGIVTGLEFSATGLNVRTSEPSPYVADDTFKTSMNHLLLGSARIGYTTGKFLFYADGGLAAGKISMVNSITQKLPDKDDYYYVFSSEKSGIPAIVWDPVLTTGRRKMFRSASTIVS